VRQVESAVGGVALIVAFSGASIASAAGGPADLAATPVSCPAPATTPALRKFTQQLTVPSGIDLRRGGTAHLLMRNGTHQFRADLPAMPTLDYATAGANGDDVYG
jgi:hypothetical protein